MAPYEPCARFPMARPSHCLGIPSVLRGVLDSTASHFSFLHIVLRGRRWSDIRIPGVTGRSHWKRPTCGRNHGRNLEKCAQLKAVWAQSKVRIASASWRSEIQPGGVLSRPDRLGTPWLFSADPMTYHEEGYADDDQLYRADIDRLAEALLRFVESGKPGADCLFVYSVRPEVRPLFWSFAEELCGRIGAVLTMAWITHQGGDRNLAAVLCPPAMLTPMWLPDPIQCGQ